MVTPIDSVLRPFEEVEYNSAERLRIGVILQTAPAVDTPFVGIAEVKHDQTGDPYLCNMGDELPTEVIRKTGKVWDAQSVVNALVNFNKLERFRGHFEEHVGKIGLMPEIAWQPPQDKSA